MLYITQSMEVTLVLPLLPNTIFKILFFPSCDNNPVSEYHVMFLLCSQNLYIRIIDLPSANPLSFFDSLSSCITFLYSIKTGLINKYYLNSHENSPSISPSLPFSLNNPYPILSLNFSWFKLFIS